MDIFSQTNETRDLEGLSLNQIKNWMEWAGLCGSWAFWISPRPTIVEVGAPVATFGALDVVAVGVFGYRRDGPNRGKAVVGVNDLEVAKVAGLSEAHVGEVARAHLSGGVDPIGLHVDNFTTPFHHGGMVRQVSEDLCGPVTHQHVVSQAHPPIAQLWILDNITEITTT